MNNVQEVWLHAFVNYCTSTETSLTYSVPYEYAQNGLVEAFTKNIQLVARPLLYMSNFLLTFRAILFFMQLPFYDCD